MPKYVSYDEMIEILDNKYLLPFRKDERLRGLNGIDIVRCKDCKWYEHHGCAIQIVDDSDKPNDNDFCSFAESEGRERDK